MTPRLGAVPGAILLASAGFAALLSQHVVSAAAIALVLLGVCLRGARRRRWLYVFAPLSMGVGVLCLSPFLQVTGESLLWSGPVVPVLGMLDVTVEEIEIAALNGLRLTALGLAFAAYALLLDHDRLLAAFGFARRSALAVALATRLIPTLERDAAGFTEALQGRGLRIDGARGRARLLSPLVSSSLERAASLAESMEARGYGRARATRAPRSAWSRLDRVAVAATVPFVVVAVAWL